MFPAVISCVPVVSATARVAPDSAVRHQFAVRADFGFVRGEDVGRRGDPPVLDDLDPHHPAVFGRLDPGDALGLFPGQLGDLAQACLTRPGGCEAGVAIAAGTPSAVPTAVATVQLWLLLRKLVLRLLGKLVQGLLGKLVLRLLGKSSPASSGSSSACRVVRRVRRSAMWISSCYAAHATWRTYRQG